MQRRELFKSFTKPFKDDEILIIRPPYFEKEEDFTNGCIECTTKDCASICEEQIIVIQDDGTPILNFSSNGCTYCDECAKVCTQDVLKVENLKNIDLIFSIDTSLCMSWNSTMCFSCKDPCLDNAIEFTAMFKPIIHEEKCTSCGFCIGVCPTNAIKIVKG
jgi:ferredoxin-type protein NapF